MKKAWNRMRRFKVYDWLNRDGAWMAIVLFGLGCFGWGFSIATMHAQAERTQELQVNFGVFNSALAAKDKLINTLVRSTVAATGQANDAMAASVVASDSASKDMKDLKAEQKVKDVKAADDARDRGH